MGTTTTTNSKLAPYSPTAPPQLPQAPAQQAHQPSQELPPAAETVERALGGLRVDSAVGVGRGGGRRGHGRHGEAKDIKVPTTSKGPMQSSTNLLLRLEEPKRRW